MFWYYYDYLAATAIVLQVLFLFNTYQNYRYAIKKSARDNLFYHPCTLLTIPCKGIDSAFERNIKSLFDLDYQGYYLHFVVEDITDPAYEVLCRLKDKLASSSKALDVRILVAGHSDNCGQKIYNLLYSCSNVPKGVEIFAFADSDACLRPDWLSHLVYPLRSSSKRGASTGYRWFVPQQNNLPSLVLSAINAKIAQMLGSSIFNKAWGGSMAIRTETFYRIGLDKIWKNALSDDLCLSRAVKKAHMKVVFVPACLVASYEKTTWVKLFEFVRRQFLITRVTMPGTWWFGMFSSVYSLAGLWAGGALAVYAGFTDQSNLKLYISVPVLFFLGQMIRAGLRQKMIVKLLPHEAERLKAAIITDILGNCLWSWLLFFCILSSAFGRTITWRGIRYRLIGPTEIKIISSRQEEQ